MLNFFPQWHYLEFMDSILNEFFHLRSMLVKGFDFKATSGEKLVFGKQMLPK